MKTSKSFRLSEDTAQLLQQMAETLGISQTHMVNRLIWGNALAVIRSSTLIAIHRKLSLMLGVGNEFSFGDSLHPDVVSYNIWHHDFERSKNGLAPSILFGVIRVTLDDVQYLINVDPSGMPAERYNFYRDKFRKIQDEVKKELSKPS